MSEVTMPRLSDTMEEGELARWLKNVGDRVEKGDVIAEIETDKATMDLEVFESGVLERQLVEEGTMVPIGQAIAVIGDGSSSGEAPAGEGGEKAEPSETDAAKAGGTEAAGPESAGEPSTEGAETATQAPAKGTEPAPKAEATESEEPAPTDEPPSEEGEPAEERSGRGDTTLRMSPLARKLAHDNDIDVKTLTGTGPEGRIIRADIEAAIEAKGAAGEEQPSAAKPAAAAAAVTEDSEVVPLNKIRKVTARRLAESQAVPHFFLTTVASVDRLIALRAEVNQGLADQGVKVSINDFVVKAAAIALRQHPEANASFNGDSILRHRRVNVGVAVATDAGLFVPVVKDADLKSLSTIGSEIIALAGRARDGKLSLDEMTGGTFSVSNLGMFGIDEFTAMLNPPEAGILAVGAASPVPALRDGELVEVQKLKLTLTVDHRAMDGATGAAFLRDLTAILEQPLRILV